MINVKFLNPFLEAAGDVFSTDLRTSFKRGALSLEQSTLTTDDITVLIHLVGQVCGVVLFGLSYQTAIASVSRIMEQEFKEFDNLAQSGVAELGNVISGRATVKLSQAGYQTTISTPSLIIGKGLHISLLDYSRIVVPLVTDLGEIMVHLAVREA